jgi:hypothetical protein
LLNITIQRTGRSLIIQHMQMHGLPLYSILVNNNKTYFRSKHKNPEETKHPIPTDQQNTRPEQQHQLRKNIHTCTSPTHISSDHIIQRTTSMTSTRQSTLPEFVWKGCRDMSYYKPSVF